MVPEVVESGPDLVLIWSWSGPDILDINIRSINWIENNYIIRLQRIE